MKQLLFFCGLICLFLSGCASSRTIVHGVEEREANEIMVFLNGKGIDATKTQMAATGAASKGATLYDISVPEAQATQAMSLLNIAGLPRKSSQSLLNIFSGGGLVPSQMEEQIRYRQGLDDQIASTLRKIDGVIDADVLVSYPEQDPLNPEKSMGKMTAAVFLKHNGVLDDPNTSLVSKIRRLVAASVPGLSYDDVTVIGDRGRNTLDIQTPIVNPAQEQIVTVWGLSLTQGSVHRFQILFFTISILFTLLLLAFVWLVWKVFPLIKQLGGIKELMHVTPLHFEVVPPKEEAPPPEPPQDEKGMEPDTKDK